MKTLSAMKCFKLVKELRNECDNILESKSFLVHEGSKRKKFVKIILEMLGFIELKKREKKFGFDRPVCERLYELR